MSQGSCNIIITSSSLKPITFISRRIWEIFWSLRTGCSFPFNSVFVYLSVTSIIVYCFTSLFISQTCHFVTPNFFRVLRVVINTFTKVWVRLLNSAGLFSAYFVFGRISQPNCLMYNLVPTQFIKKWRCHEQHLACPRKISPSDRHFK